MGDGILPPKQARFVEEYLKDLNATKAATRAGYSEKTSQEQGSRLLSNVMVKRAIEKAKAERAERTKIDADWLLKRLAQEADADVNDLYDDDGTLKAVSEWPLIWRTGLVAGIDTVQEYETTDGKKERVGSVTKIKLSDRVKRLELIGKHINVGAFRDNVHHSGSLTLEGMRDQLYGKDE